TRASAPSTPSGTCTPRRRRSRSAPTWRASRSGATTRSPGSQGCPAARRAGDVSVRLEGRSGGEKGRLTLAVVIKQRHNLLPLDEPTNHLDLDSREALEESLEDFAGSIVFVSHDRAFIDRIASRVLDLREG